MISLLSLVPMRSTAAESSEMVSQLLFGEEVEVLEIIDNWTKIKTLHDAYEAWVDTKMLYDYQRETNNFSVVTSLAATLKLDDVLFPVTMGALLPKIKDDTFYFGNRKYELIEGEITTHALETDAALQAVYQLQNAPYLWGGRSPFGIDCSGFSQLFYRLIGKSIPRDASQQIALGDDVFLSEAQTGDLAFFEKEGQVTHVGVLINSSRIIHASGYVRIDMIDANGVFVNEKQAYSHRLVGVKRL